MELSSTSIYKSAETNGPEYQKRIDAALLHLETDRLFLRPFSDDDLPLIERISSDPDTVRYLNYWGRPGYTPETDARRFLDYALKSWREKPIRAREYCLILKQTGEAIGDGSLEWVHGRAGIAEIGWILLPEYRKQGYATEMAEKLLRAGFEVLKADAVISHCDARNAASFRVMERLGMHLECIEKETRNAKTPGGKKGDECTCMITRGQWEIYNRNK